MSLVEAVEIVRARLQLEVPVDALTTPGKEELDDGRRAKLMPLLSALEDRAEGEHRAESYRSTVLASIRSPLRLGG